MHIRLLLNFTGKHSACMSGTAYACIMRYKRMCNYIKWLTFLHLINGHLMNTLHICKEQIQLLLYMDLQYKTNF